MRTERYVSSSFANFPVCVANARDIDPGKPPDLWGLLNRHFRYGPIAAPVTASTEPPRAVGALVNTSQNVNDRHPAERWRLCMPLASWFGHSDRVLLRHRRRAASRCSVPVLPVPDSGSGRMPRQPLDAREDLAEERPCQVYIRRGAG